MKKRLLCTSAALALAAGISTAASAATVLETMQQMMAADGAPPEAFTYDSVVSDTETGFEIVGVSIEPEPGEGAVTIDRLKIDAIDMAAMDSDSMPVFMTMVAEGITVPAEQMDADMLEVFPDGMTFDLGIDYSIDKAGNGLDLRNLSIAVDGYGEVALSLQVTGLTEEAIGGMMFMGPEALMGEGISLAGFTLMFDDEGGLGQIYEVLAAEEGMDVDSYVTMSVLPQMQMMGAMFAADPIAAGVVNALSGFVADYASPGGPLTIRAEPPAPVSLMSLMTMGDPTGFSALLGLSASYEGGDGASDRGSSLFSPDGDDSN